MIRCLGRLATPSAEGLAADAALSSCTRSRIRCRFLTRGARSRVGAVGRGPLPCEHAAVPESEWITVGRGRQR